MYSSIWPTVRQDVAVTLSQRPLSLFVFLCDSLGEWQAVPCSGTAAKAICAEPLCENQDYVTVSPCTEELLSAFVVGEAEWWADDIRVDSADSGKIEAVVRYGAVHAVHAWSEELQPALIAGVSDIFSSQSSTNGEWKCTRSKPSGNWQALMYDDSEWEPVRCSSCEPNFALH